MPLKEISRTNTYILNIITTAKTIIVCTITCLLSGQVIFPHSDFTPFQYVIILFSVFSISFPFYNSRPEGLEPSTSGFGDRRSTN